MAKGVVMWRQGSQHGQQITEAEELGAKFPRRGLELWTPFELLLA